MKISTLKTNDIKRKKNKNKNLMKDVKKISERDSSRINNHIQFIFSVFFLLKNYQSYYKLLFLLFKLEIYHFL